MPDQESPFDLDLDGNIITCPVVGWTNAPAAQMFIISRIEHVQSDDHLTAALAGTAKPDAVQLTFTPQQALEFASNLTRLANLILRQKTPGPQHQN